MLEGIPERDRRLQSDSGDNVAKQHRLLACRMTLETKKRDTTKVEPRIKWWKLKKEDCCEEFREEIRRALGGKEELPDDWTRKGHSKKGTRSVIETEERRQGDLVVGCGSAGKHTEEEIGEEEG